MKIKAKMVKVFEVEVEAPEFLRPVVSGMIDWGELRSTDKEDEEFENWIDAVEEKYEAQFLEDDEWTLVEGE